MQLNSHGEIVDVNEADQFQPAKSQFECGYFACAIARSMAPVGSPPALSAAQIISDAEGWYAQYDGTDAITNTNGMTLAQEYNLLAQIGLHYQATATDIAVVKKWIEAGYPVLVAIVEASVHDLALGDASPYPWTPVGTHVILVTGVAQDGNVLVRDSANCTDLNNPNSLRPGPRPYDAAKLQLVSATAVVPPWMPRPAGSTPPTPTAGGSMVPQGWTDDGTTLRSPNGAPITLGFRAFILSHAWDKDNWALGPEQGLSQLEGSNKALGGGTQQMFRWAMLGWTQERGVFVEWVGVELAYQRQQYAALYAAYQKLAAQGQAVDPRVAQYEGKLKAVSMLAAQIVQQAQP